MLGVNGIVGGGLFLVVGVVIVERNKGIGCVVVLFGGDGFIN